MAALAVQLAFTGLGNAIGIGIPALGLTGAGVGSLVGSVVSSFLFPPPDVKNYGPRLSDLSVTSSTYGKAIPICYGTIPVSGDIIDASTMYETAHKETQSGGKGGGQEVSYTTYTYSVDLAIGLCEGPIDGILQIFANEKLIYDARESSNFLKPSWLSLTIYKGTETQLPDSTLEALHGAGSVPAYRGLAYVVFPRFPLQEFGNRPPTFRFVIVKNGDETISENVIDLSPVSTTAHGPVYFDETGLMYGSIETNPSSGSHNLFAIDPLSKNIVWSTPLVDPGGADIDQLHAPEVVSISIETTTGIVGTSKDYVVLTGKGGLSGDNARIAFVDANSGYVYDVQELVNTGNVYYDSARALYPDQLVFIKVTNGLVNPDFFSVHVFDREDLTQARYGITLPDDWQLGGDGLVAIKQAEFAMLAAEIDEIAGSDVGVAIWSDEFRPSGSGYQPDYTIVNLGSTMDGLITIRYDAARDLFITANDYGDGRIEFTEIDMDGNATTYNWNTLYGISASFDPSPLVGDEFENGYLWVRTVDDDLYRWDIANKTTPVEYSDTTANRNFHYESVTQSMWGAVSDDIIEYQFNRLADNQVTLASIVADLSGRVGLDSGDYDTSEIASTLVRGYVIGNIMPARSAIDPLRKVFLFDHADTGAQIEFRPLGQSVVRTLGLDDIGAHANGSSSPPVIEIDRVQEIDLPKELSVTYMDVNANYEIGHQRARIISSSSKQSIGIEFPIALNHTEAAQAADVLLHLAYIERESYKVQAMPVHADLIPSNVINISDGTTVFRMGIKEKLSEQGVIKLTGVRDEPAVLTSTVSGGEITGRDATIFIAGIMQFSLLNVPALRDEDMAAGFYLAGYSYSDGWPGGVLFRSNDGSVFGEVATITTPTTVGRVWNTPDGSDFNLMDNLSELDITLYANELSSTTKALLLTSNINAAAYGTDGRWEIIQFQNATLEANGHYTVTDLIRGRLGTESAIDLHQTGDLFILLDGVRRITANQSDIDTDLLYRGVTLGRSIYEDTNREITHTHEGSGLIPYSPVHLVSTTDSALDVTLTWMPRTRQIWQNFWSAIESDAEAYEVDIYDDTPTLLRTVTGLSSATTTYTRAQQETDLGDDTLDTVTFKVYHVSDVTGRGHVAELDVELGPPPNPIKDYVLTLGSTPGPYLYWGNDILSGTEVTSWGTYVGANEDLDLKGVPVGNLGQDSMFYNDHGFSIKFEAADYAHHNAFSSLATGTDKTASFMFLLETSPSADHAIWYIDGYPSAFEKIKIELLSTKHIKFSVRDTGDTTWVALTSTTALSLDTPYLITASIGSTDGMKLYINGTKEASNAGQTTHLVPSSSHRIALGDAVDLRVANFPDVRFDNVMYWKDQLTDDEVLGIWNRV